MTHSKIILLGMPGAGKSTFGRLLASALGYKFVDLDDAIEHATGQSIPDLFEISEKHFRQQETAALKEVISDDKKLVIALGGGTPCFNENMTIILEKGVSIFIDPPMSTLVRRTEKESHRPLLRGQPISERLATMYEHRKNDYQRAHLTITAESPDVQDVINRLSALRS